ncbi:MULTISPECIES: long-chain-fatty-acid--CoA ligase [unclassified Curtobacterium]|uniref:long-chain-fatty-acid--CoA ligase n=1 Tax=unclassified Curtobacterium TaxID=257496 RepID=UPI0008DCE620|nr:MULTISPECIES: long-chain-fatty-acid--CoA ligase [unclassified Curtobacterium]OIH96867.1 long-chain fatty acid--CoA ligase [Curtobacterium sp. MCBA15_003]OII09366.1 long-chain fatty acid--CoA ligase [Curtobacterium sp. MCBA15_009]OII29070.1 long-chain fatty acid--CoA ligase [Curtobacterium sp. MMLR14_006]
MSIDTPRPWLASYAPGVPHDIDEQRGSLVDLVEQSAQEFPRRVALEFFKRTTSYGELEEQIRRAANGLRKLGVGAGDRVAIVLPNCPQHVVAFYAVLRLGAIVVEHNPLYTPRELRHQFEDHGAKVAIAWDKSVATLQDFPADVALDAIVSVDLTRAMPRSTRLALALPVAKARESRAKLTTSVRGTTKWDDLVGSRKLSKRHPRPSTDDVALIQYTSGTTGTPKGAVLTHRNLLANAAQSRAWVPQVRRGDNVVYAVLPMFHAYGLTLCLTFAMSMASRLVLFPSFDPALVLTAVKKHPPTFLPAVPPIYARLQHAADSAKVSLAGIEIGISGAMPLSQEIVEPWESRTGGYLVEGYGLSECSPVLMANPVSPERRLGSIGLPLSSTEARVVDPDDAEKVLGTDEPGELQVRGPQVFRGYWGKAEATDEVFTSDGWFRTGDIVSIGADGYVRIVDRLKELIITGGFNVSPSEVEDALLKHPSVKEVAVVGITTAGNEQVVAAVVPKDPSSFDPAALRAWAREQLAAYKVPRRIVVVDDLPRSMIGKVLRRKVRDRILADD